MLDRIIERLFAGDNVEYKNEAAAVPAVTAFVKPKPIVRVEINPIERIEEYVALAEELGCASVMSGKVLQRMVADFLWEKDVDTYRLSDVVSYLSRLADHKGSKLCWRPLREKDHSKKFGWNSNSNGHDFYWFDDSNCRSYEHPVPFDVLQNVKALCDRFPDRLHFFVSDYADPNPDPFILVTARNMNRIVFGVWDEPAFFKK